MPRFRTLRSLSVLVLFALLPAAARVSAAAAASAAPLPIVGRWDVTVTVPDGATHPGWFEIREESSGLAMRMVGRAGAPFDVPFVAWDGRHLEFQLADGTRWRGDFNGRWLEGTAGRLQLEFRGPAPNLEFRVPAPSTAPDPGGHARRPSISWEPLREIPVDEFVPVHRLRPDGARWTAVRAPALPERPVRWGKPVALFDGRTLAGWRPRHEGSKHGWTVRDGALSNRFPADDLVSLESYGDFMLHLQYRLQPGEDSGVHLRGRYEVQVTDREDPAAFAGSNGSVYGMVAPAIPAQAKPGEWNTLDVTLVGRVVSVSLNGVRIIDRQEIPGVTGDALDAREGRPGPIVLQGYLGRVEYRDVVVTPAL